MVDATYKLNNLRMPVFLQLIVDGNGESEIVFVVVRQVNTEKMSISLDQKNLCLEIIKKIAYSAGQDDYKEDIQALYDTKVQPVITYFNQCWEPIKHQWVIGLKQSYAQMRASQDNCPLCTNVLRDEERVVIGEKGAEGINQAIIERGDRIIVSSGTVVHKKCRMNYINKKQIDLYKKAKFNKPSLPVKRSAHTSIGPYDSRTHCLFCGNEIKKASRLLQ
ncbi:Hypothetical predicted protein [Paramuricea clavata]|uniref:Uncharacterized protein n=1 Tax=Paramuricea clavata TaxID=317549 RepID=A0A6S7H333_PARCT|nr:Hypothetical predicted protein [Paramuricea clavata]